MKLCQLNILLGYCRQKFFRISFVISLSLMLLSCIQSPQNIEATMVASVAATTLIQSDQALASEFLLDIGVLVFDPGLFNQQAPQNGDLVFAQIRQSEAQFLPYVLRDTLVKSNQWGAVRVLPKSDPAVDLLVSGTILQSDGVILQLQLRAWDSTEREWLNKTYTDFSKNKDYPQINRHTISRKIDFAQAEDPFTDLYKQISNDLLAVREALEKPQLSAIQQVSQLQYARDLSPDSFAHHLVELPDGPVSVRSLPAINDPMFTRVASMRVRHHLYIDTVDEHYEALHNEMQPTYTLWRQYSREQIQQTQAREKRTAKNQESVRRLDFTEMKRSYENYKWSKIYQQEFAELASAFNRELAPAVLDLNDHVIQLSGSVGDQYVQWRAILREIFALDTGTE